MSNLRVRFQVTAALAFVWGCGATGPSAAEPTSTAPDGASEVAVSDVLDQWHAAAARADEETYFGLLTEDAVFLGTDATERWDVAEFREFAHPHFANGKAWTFWAMRRAVRVAPNGQVAWFDEDLHTEKLGPARGSGVVVWLGDRWRIAHYNLALTVPNDRFVEIRDLLAASTAASATGHP